MIPYNDKLTFTNQWVGVSNSIGLAIGKRSAGTNL